MSAGRHVKEPVLRPSIFGADQPYYDLSSMLPRGAGSIVVATAGRHGFRPTRVCLPHQLYEGKLPTGDSEVWVLPVLSPWLQVAGPLPGSWHPEEKR